ncbi:MAG: cysteate synthase, partial [Methanothrix sp.]|nr:cysteate synthase [Methanothrix sp.]
DLTLLNITGGGISRAKEELKMNYLKCDIEVSPSAFRSESTSTSYSDLLAEIDEILGRRG